MEVTTKAVQLHGGYGYTQVPVPQTERWIVHKENEDSKDKK